MRSFKISTIFPKFEPRQTRLHKNKIKRCKNIKNFPSLLRSALAVASWAGRKEPPQLRGSAQWACGKARPACKLPSACQAERLTKTKGEGPSDEAGTRGRIWKRARLADRPPPLLLVLLLLHHRRCSHRSSTKDAAACRRSAGNPLSSPSSMTCYCWCLVAERVSPVSFIIGF